MRWGVLLAGLLLCVGQAPPVAFLRGKVIDSATGRPLGGATVSLAPASKGPARLSISSKDGSYFFRPLVIGVDYELKADHDGLASTVRTLRVSNPNEIVTIDLTVSPRIQFEDVTARTGIGFTLRNAATGHLHQPEIMLGGIAAFDFNNDGCTDIFAVNGAALPSLAKSGPEYHNRLYRNNCDLTFTDVTDQAGLAGKGYSMGVAAADFDNDGFVDLFVTGVAGNFLYRNRGDGTFEDVTAKAGLQAADKMWSVSAGWFDYDNDGLLDLFVTSYVAWSPEMDLACSAGGNRMYCHPRDYKGLPNRLYHNNGNGAFTDVSEASGIRASIGKGMGVAFGDFNGDGLTDVFVTNDSVPNFLFRNLGNGKFKETAIAAGVAYNAHGKAVAGMGADFRDCDNDGLDDIALNAMYYDGFTLYRNRSGRFEDETQTSGLVAATRNLTGWGMGMFDFDNDGHKDLFYAIAHFPGSEPLVHADAAQPNRIVRNLGGCVFEDVSKYAGPDFQRPAQYRGAAFADFDNDGRVDVAVTAVNGALRLLRNVSPNPGHWIALRMIGTKSNHDGLGASVRLTLPTGAKRYNHATTAVGYGSSSEPLVRFGLGPYESAAEIEIRWAGGKVQRLTNVKADQIVTVTER